MQSMVTRNYKWIAIYTANLAVRLIHPSDVLQILLHTNVPSVKTFLNGKIQQLQSFNKNMNNIEKTTETINEEIKFDVDIQEPTETNLDSYELKEESDCEEIGPELSTYTEEESTESTESNTILNNLEQYKNIPKSHYMYIVLNPETFENTRQVKIGRATNISKLVRCYTRYDYCKLVFYRDCKSFSKSVLSERNVFDKLKKYRKNHINEYFVIPPDGNLQNFIDVINQCVDFLLDVKEDGVTWYIPQGF